MKGLDVDQNADFITSLSIWNEGEQEGEGFRASFSGDSKWKMSIFRQIYPDHCGNDKFDNIPNLFQVKADVEYPFWGNFVLMAIVWQS